MFIDIQLFNKKETFVDLRLYFYRIKQATVYPSDLSFRKINSLIKLLIFLYNQLVIGDVEAKAAWEAT